MSNDKNPEPRKPQLCAEHRSAFPCRECGETVPGESDKNGRVFLLLSKIADELHEVREDEDLLNGVMHDVATVRELLGDPAMPKEYDPDAK